jgi:hypothetical protein
MENPGTLLEEVASLEGDPCRKLVEKIIASQTFGKTARLSQFLSYVCECSLTGRSDEINEQNIGEHVFERTAGYDPGQDNIVRVQASRLRQRLETYFNEEGASEQLRIVIPKGTYVPQFGLAQSQHLHADPVEPNLVEDLSHAASGSSGLSPDTTASPPRMTIRRRWWLFALILCILCPALWEVAYLRYEGPGASISFFGLQLVAVPSDPGRPLWKELFQRGQTTLIVPCDSGLVMYEAQSGKSINLAQYLSGEVQIVPVLNPSTTIDRPTNRAAYRYTSIVDLQVTSRLMTLAEPMPGHTVIRYARDLKLDDLKGNNIVLIGAKEANPWVELFEQHMNFTFDDRRDTYDFVVTNRAPRSGESQVYKMVPDDPAHRAYALVAFIPNLNRTGNVLIVEGSTMAGTEAAADFAFEGNRLMTLLHAYLHRDGTLPHFEVLLQTSSVGGGAPESSVVSYRIDQN